MTFLLKRWRKTVIFFITVGYAIANAWRAIAISQQATLLQAYEPTISTNLRFYIAIIWAIIFTIFAITNRSNGSKSKIALPFAILIYALYRYVLFARFAQSVYAKESAIFFTLVHIFFALLVFITNRPVSYTHLTLPTIYSV